MRIDRALAFALALALPAATHAQLASWNEGAAKEAIESPSR
jgi:hypothetical protein